jgi:hypothetical protein
MVHRCFVNIEPIEPSGVVLTIEVLPRLLIFGETPDDALLHAREAVSFLLRDAFGSMGGPSSSWWRAKSVFGGPGTR